MKGSELQLYHVYLDLDDETILYIYLDTTDDNFDYTYEAILDVNIDTKDCVSAGIKKNEEGFKDITTKEHKKNFIRYAFYTLIPENADFKIIGLKPYYENN